MMGRDQQPEGVYIPTGAALYPPRPPMLEAKLLRSNNFNRAGSALSVIPGSQHLVYLVVIR